MTGFEWGRRAVGQFERLDIEAELGPWQRLNLQDFWTSFREHLLGNLAIRKGLNDLNFHSDLCKWLGN